MSWEKGSNRPVQSEELAQLVGLPAMVLIDIVQTPVLALVQVSILSPHVAHRHFQ
jgi:hypothetical protein